MPCPDYILLKDADSPGPRFRGVSTTSARVIVPSWLKVGHLLAVRIKLHGTQCTHWAYLRHLASATCLFWDSRCQETMAPTGPGTCTEIGSVSTATYLFGDSSTATLDTAPSGVP